MKSNILIISTFLTLLMVQAKANFTGNCLRTKWNGKSVSEAERSILGMKQFLPMYFLSPVKISQCKTLE